MKKFVALTLAISMLFSVPVFASGGFYDDYGIWTVWNEEKQDFDKFPGGPDSVLGDSDCGTDVSSTELSSCTDVSSTELSSCTDVSSTELSSCTDVSSTELSSYTDVSSTELSSYTSETAVAPSGPPSYAVEGVPTKVALAAWSEGKTVYEYMNNAITVVPGLGNVSYVGQGSGVIINGVETGLVFTLEKPYIVEVTTAKALAASLGGNIMNVVAFKGAKFDTAQVNFYMPDVVAGQNIKVCQYVNGDWTEVSVAEIREDHVVVDLTSYGTLAFIEIPAAE